MTDDPAGGMSDGFKAMADFWSTQGKAMIEAQQDVARAMVEGMQTMFGTGATLPASGIAAPPELAQAGEAMMQLWSAATSLSAQLTGQLGNAAGGSAAAKNVIERLTDPRQWMLGNVEMDEALARMVDGPRFADLWDVERRYGSVMRRWTDLRQRSVEHQRLVLDAWMQAGKLYLTELAGRTGPDGKPLELKQALALWIEIGNRHMLATQRSEAFLKSQREMIRASTELRFAQGELSEFIGKHYGLPTRTELDDVHRTLTEMRRELRKVRRELDAAKQANPAAALKHEMPPETLQPKRPTKSRSSVTRPAASRREAR